jgi:hypothetical protein
LIYNKDKTFNLRNEKLFEKPVTVNTGKLAYGGLTLEQYYNDNMIKFLAIDNAFSKVKQKLNEEYSFKRTNFDSDLYSAKGKKINYDDLEQAFSLTKDALRKTEIKGEPNADQKAMLDNAIALWEKALAEADTNNISARINKPIYHGLNVNIAIAQAWKGNFEHAWERLNSVRGNEFSSNVKSTLKWLAAFETGWMINHPEKVSDAVQGNWKVSFINTRGKFDLNKDGQASSEILSEMDACKKNQFYTFGADRKATLTTGKGDSCEKVESLFWRVAKNSKEDRNYILFADNADYLSFSESDGIFKIRELGYNKLVISGESRVDPSSDTTDEVEITFTRN